MHVHYIHTYTHACSIIYITHTLFTTYDFVEYSDLLSTLDINSAQLCSLNNV